MLDNLSNRFIFTNHTKVLRNYLDIFVEDKDDWTKVIDNKENKLERFSKTDI